MPEHIKVFKDHVTLSDIHSADNVVCKDNNSLKSANYVVLFEDPDLVRRLVNAVRHVCNKDNRSQNYMVM